MEQEEDKNVQYQSKKDKFHLIRVPKGFDISRLNGVEFDPHQILEIQVHKDDSGLVNVFEIGSFTEQQMDLNVLVNKDDAVKIGPRINQNFLVTKNVRLQSNLSTVNKESKQAVSLPQGLRERFTPFGSVSPVKNNRKSASRHKKKKRQRSPDNNSPVLKSKKIKEEVDVQEKNPTKANKKDFNKDVKIEKLSPKKEISNGAIFTDEPESVSREKKHKSKKKKKDKD